MKNFFKFKKIFLDLIFIAVSFGLLNAPFFLQETQAQSNLSATCSVSPLSVNVGQQAVFTVSVSGGTGFYQYSWSGTDGLSGNTQSVAKVYTTAGKKNATVMVTSGGQTVTPTCILEVKQISQPLSASCFPQSSTVYVSETVKWTAQVTGGAGGYKYLWSGTDNLQATGRNPSKKYTYPGLKQATVIITSGNQSMVRTCSVNVIPDPILSGSCVADFSSVGAGQSVTWTAQASGGVGNYKYSWNGTNNLSGSKQAISKVYNNLGHQTASVQITSGDQTITRNCAVNFGAVAGAFTQVPAAGVLNVSCFVSPLAIEVGQQAVWTAITSGGIGYYNYLWTGTENLQGNTRLISKIYNTPGVKTATITVNSGILTKVSACTLQVFEKGALPSGAGGVVLGQLPYTGITLNKWKIFSTLVLIIAIAFILLVARSLKKKAKLQKKQLAFAYGNDGIEKNIAEIVQTECKKREVLISIDALKELMTRSQKEISKSLKNLGEIIDRLKEPPPPMVSGEERWPVIGKKDVDKHFLKLGISHNVDN